MVMKRCDYWCAAVWPADSGLFRCVPACDVARAATAARPGTHEGLSGTSMSAYTDGDGVRPGSD